VPTLFSESATCDEQFFKMFEDPEVLLTGENGSFFIVVSGEEGLRRSSSRNRRRTLKHVCRYFVADAYVLRRVYTFWYNGNNVPRLPVG